jgi:hypothetical protein
MDVDETVDTTKRAGGMDRRSFVRNAAAVGAVAWTTPVIVGSLVSPAAAGTLPSQCYKYQYNWALGPTTQNLQECANLEKHPPQSWTNPCAHSLPLDGFRAGETKPGSIQNKDKYKSNSAVPNRNCCIAKDAGGNSIDWWWGDSAGREMVDTWPNNDCILITPDCPPFQPATGYKNETIQFKIDHTRCPGCYFADAMVFYTTNPAACPTPPSTGISTSTNAAGESDFFTGVRFQFGAQGKWPIHFKFWIGCNLNWGADSNQYVPNTQCRIPKIGAPAGTPAKQMHDKGEFITVTV